jgi:hypothetical protein
MVNFLKALAVLSVFIGLAVASHYFDDIKKWFAPPKKQGIVYQDFVKLPNYEGFKHEMGASIQDLQKREFGIACYRKDKDLIIVFERFLYQNDNHPVWELLDTIRIREKANEDWYADNNFECQHQSDQLNQYVYIVKSLVEGDTFKPLFNWQIDFENGKLIPYSIDSMICIFQEVD